MEAWMLEIVESFGYTGVLLLIWIENVFPPIPSEAVLLFAGALCKWSDLSAGGMILAATAGSMLGAVLLYEIGSRLSRERLEQFLSGRIARILHIKYEHVASALNWFEQYGNKAVFFCRFIPIVRSLISLPAGMVKMPLGSFCLLSFLGSLIWNSLLILTGNYLGSAWQQALPILQEYSGLMIAAALAVVCGGCFWWFWNRRKKTA